MGKSTPGAFNKDLPAAIKIATLFHRRRMIIMGLNGLTSLRESSMAGRTGAGGSRFSRSAISVLELLTLPPLGLLSALEDRMPAILCLRTFWYVRLRSRRNVSLKKKRNARVKMPDSIAKNQKVARQLNETVRVPPNIGPIAYEPRIYMKTKSETPKTHTVPISGTT